MATTYAQILSQLRGHLRSTVRDRMEAGRLVDEAMRLGVSPFTIAADTMVPQPTLMGYRRVYCFWRNPRTRAVRVIKDCTVWSHHASVSDANDVKRRDALLRGGHALCKANTFDAIGATKHERTRSDRIENWLSLVLIELNATRKPFLKRNRVRIDARLAEITDRLATLNAPGGAQYATPQPVAELTWKTQAGSCRRWARSVGMNVGVRGKLPHHVIDAWHQAGCPEVP